jgi:hypothetical protein
MDLIGLAARGLRSFGQTPELDIQKPIAIKSTMGSGSNKIYASLWNRYPEIQTIKKNTTPVNRFLKT